MAIHLLLFSSSPLKIPSQNPNPSPIPKSPFNLKPACGFHSSRTEAISIAPLTRASSLSSNALSETLEAFSPPPPPPRKQTLDGICCTESWFQVYGDEFSIRVPPQFEDIQRSEVLSVVIRPTNQLKITFLEAYIAGETAPGNLNGKMSA